MPEEVTIVGAYGRTYRSKKAILKDWNENLDFKIVNGPYINKADALRYSVKIRFRWGKYLQHTAPLREQEIIHD